MDKLKITRVVTDLVIDSRKTTYLLNGHEIWVGHGIREAGIPNSVDYYSQLYKLCDAIARDNSNVTVDMKDPVIVDFLKATECI